MTFHRRTLLLGLFVLAPALAVACSSTNSGGPPHPGPSSSATATPTPTATPTSAATATPTPSAMPTTQSLTVAVNPAGGSQPLPNAGGYGGTLTYSSNNSTAGATMTLTTTTAATTVPNPQPTGTALAYYELVLSQSITFTNGLDTASLTLPPSLNTSGHTFYDTVYDQTAGVLIGNSQAGTVSGQTVNFTSGGNSTPLNGGDRYIVVLSET